MMMYECQCRNEPYFNTVCCVGYYASIEIHRDFGNRLESLGTRLNQYNVMCNTVLHGQYDKLISLTILSSTHLLVPNISFLLQTRLGLQQLPTRLLNPSAVIQAAIPAIFKNIPMSFFDQTMEVFENNAKTCYSVLSKLPGLHPVMPAGSMFIMVGCSYYNNFVIQRIH